jgi:small subunit ribosomal protein S6
MCVAQYEIAIIYHPSLEIDLTKGEEQIHKIFAASKGKVISTDNWGKRKLAYTIKKQEFGIYVFYTVEIEPTEVKKIETALNITDEIVRYLIVKPDLKAIAQAEAKKAQKAAAHSSSSDEAEDGDEEE